MKRCPKCGKDVKKGTFCPSCAKELFYKEFLAKGLEVFELQICEECSRYFSHGIWHTFSDLVPVILKSLRTSIDKQLSKPLKYELEFDESVIDTIHDTGFYDIAFGKSKFHCVVFMLTEEYEIEVSVIIRKNLCPSCSRNDGTYFEAILQIRNANDKIVNELDSLLAFHKKKSVHANKIIKQKTGIDLYMTNQAGTKAIAQKLQQKFGGEFSIHPQLFSRDKLTSKELYRLTILYRAPKFVIGDIVKTKFGKELEVTQIGSKVFGKFVDSQKKAVVNFRDLDPKFI